MVMNYNRENTLECIRVNTIEQLKKNPEMYVFFTLRRLTMRVIDLPKRNYSTFKRIYNKYYTVEKIIHTLEYANTLKEIIIVSEEFKQRRIKKNKKEINKMFSQSSNVSLRILVDCGICNYF